MDKINKKNNTTTLKESVVVPWLLKNGQYYKLLDPSTRTGIRKKLWENCNSHINPKVSLSTWKQRFLSPEKNIPGSNAEFIIKIMEEELIVSLQEQHDHLAEKIESKKNALEHNAIELNRYAEIILLSQKVVEQFKSEKNEQKKS